MYNGVINATYIKIIYAILMSACIIPLGHHSWFIRIYMGKLRFPLTNIIFWVVLLLSCFLSENFAILNSNPLGGFEFDAALLLSITVVALLIFYYFLEHRKNGLTFDRFLLPGIGIIGLLLIINILRLGNRDMVDASGNNINIIITDNEKVMSILQIVVWLSVIYALVFVYNRFRLNKESYRWVAKVYLIAIFIMIIIDLFAEGDKIAAICDGTYAGSGLSFFFNNANIWALLLFAGVITCLLLLYKRFRWYYYTAMVLLFLYGILTTCATTLYIGIIVVPVYTFYEIFSHYKENKKQSLIKAAIFVGTIIICVSFFALFVAVKVPLFVNLWSFLEESLLNKNFLTFTGRTRIWEGIFELLKGNPMDFIFGLGHKTGTKIFKAYMLSSMAVSSAHNGIMEIFLMYGLLGLIVYIGILGLTVFAFVLRFKRKQYRYVFIYGLSFLAIMAHAFTESTTLFTPNVGGLYFSFVFVLPVINILQEKRMQTLKEELVSYKYKKEKLTPLTVFTAIILLMVDVVLTKIIASIIAIDLFCSILVAMLILLIMISIILIIEHYHNYKPITIINNRVLNHYQKLVRRDNNEE